MVGWPVVASDFCWFTSVYFWIGRFLFNFSFARLLRHHLPSCSEQQIAADVATWLLYYILHALHQLTISPSGIAATRADMSLRMSVRPSVYPVEVVGLRWLDMNCIVNISGGS